MFGKLAAMAEKTVMEQVSNVVSGGNETERQSQPVENADKVSPVSGLVKSWPEEAHNSFLLDSGKRCLSASTTLEPKRNYEDALMTCKRSQNGSLLKVFHRTLMISYFNSMFNGS